MENGIYNIMEKRVWDANICTSANCKVKFNGEALPKQTFEAYAKMHDGVDNVYSVTTEPVNFLIPSKDPVMSQVWKNSPTGKVS